MASWSFRIHLPYLGFATVVQAYEIFETTCTTPTTPANFVSSPDSRGTLDILWSCLFTIIACTWTIQHLNVPEQREGRDPGWKGDLKWKLKRIYASIKWMLITMVAPEMVMGRALADLVSAKRDLRELQKFASEDQVPWTLTHTHYANMGGFVIRSGVGENIVLGPHVGVDNMHGDYPDTKTSAGHTLIVHQPDEIIEPNHPKPDLGSTEETQRNEDTPYQNLPCHLNAQIICRLRHDKFLPKLPFISKEEIEDKSKSDAFVKIIAIVQISWATLQIIVRAARKIAISQLELAVLAFAACAVVIYCLYWTKPKNIQATTTILQYRHGIPSPILREVTKNTYDSIVQMFMSFRSDVSQPYSGNRIRNDNIYGSNDDFASLVLALTFGATLFGGIHVAAWNFSFPSKIELIFWRCASIYATAFIPSFLVLGLALTVLQEDLFNKVMSFFSPLLSFLYIVARLFLLVEIFRTLCFLPPDAYLSTWATNVPHVA